MFFTGTKVQGRLTNHKLDVSFANYTYDRCSKLKVLLQFCLGNPSFEIEIGEFCLINRYEAINVFV